MCMLYVYIRLLTAGVKLNGPGEAKARECSSLGGARVEGEGFTWWSIDRELVFPRVCAQGLVVV